MNPQEASGESHSVLGPGALSGELSGGSLAERVRLEITRRLILVLEDTKRDNRVLSDRDPRAVIGFNRAEWTIETSANYTTEAATIDELRTGEQYDIRVTADTSDAEEVDQ